jgi:hypothetical protein
MVEIKRFNGFDCLFVNGERVRRQCLDENSLGGRNLRINDGYIEVDVINDPRLEYVDYEAIPGQIKRMERYSEEGEVLRSTMFFEYGTTT